MLRVACAACRAPFKIDERKMAADVITMRCPRCGCAFKVSRVAASREGAPAPADPRARR